MLKEYKDLMARKNFLFLWISQIFTQITINVLNFTLIIRLFEITSSTIATALLWISYSLPAILVGPLASASVDLFDKKRILQLSTLAQSIIVFLFALTFKRSTFLIYAVAFGYSLMNQFYVPSEASLLPLAAGTRLLANANGIFFITQQIAIVLGFGMGSFIVKFLGFERLLFLSSFLILLAFFSTSLLSEKRNVKEPINYEKSLSKFFKLVIQGYILIKSKREVLAPFLLLLAMQVSLVVVLINAPLIVAQVFGVNLSEEGIFLILPLIMGAGVGVVVVPILLKRLRKVKVIESSLLILAILTLLGQLFLPSQKIFFEVIIESLILMLIGLAFVGVVIPSQTFMQQKTPQSFRGRVFGSFWFLVTLLTVFPVFLSGIITEVLGVKPLLFLMSFSFLILFLLVKQKSQIF